MKKFIPLLLAFVLVFSLAACGDGSEKAKEEAVSTLKDYIETKGIEFKGVKTLICETGIPNTSIYFVSQDDSTGIIFTADVSELESVNTNCSTSLWFSGFEKQEKGCYYVYQVNTVGSGEFSFSIDGGTNFKPSEFKSDTVFKLQAQISDTGNPDNETSERFEDICSDGLNTMLEILHDILAKSGLNITLDDLGFTNYEINPSRVSEIKQSAVAKKEVSEAKEENVEPAPVDISIISLITNSAGTPELTMQFKNTSNKAITALDFYVICYDAYGEVVKGYGKYDVYSGTYQEGISANGSSYSDWYWGLFGFDNTKSVEVAITKYKLDGEPAVEIPENQLVWCD